MARRSKKRHGGKGSKLIPTVFKFLRIGALVAPAFAEYEAMSGPPLRKVGRVISQFGGYNLDGQRFEWDLLTRMWSPYVATTLVTIGVGKLNSIMRRI